MRLKILLVKIGNHIKKIRASKNMTQNKLALECDLEKASLSRIEAGKVNTTVKTLDKISDALDVDVSELFDDKL